MAATQLRLATSRRQPKAQLRRDRLLPSGVPRYLRCYDAGADGSIDRYCVVYTGRYAGRNGRCHYLSMSSRPFHPQGVGQHGECDHIIDRPVYSHFGKRIRFTDLPEDCQKLVLADYRAIWRLQ